MTILLLLVSVAAAADQKIAMKDLPVAVREAVQRMTQGATLKGLATEVEGGKTLYEAETIRDGRHRDLLFDANGQLVEVEEQIAVDAAPAAVKAALQARGRILRLESVTRGTRVTYEGVVDTHGKKAEVAVDADGKPVRR